MSPKEKIQKKFDKKDWKQLANRLFLENTRVIYDLMSELSNRCTNLSEAVINDWKYEGYQGKESLFGRKNIISSLRGSSSGNANKDTVQSLIDDCYDKDGKLLSQNPFSSYLKFYKTVFGVEASNDCDKIVEMLNYYNILCFLTEPKFTEKRHECFDYFPYIFEDICLSIKNMTDAKSCYMVYKKEREPSQLISRSGYVVVRVQDECFPINAKIDNFSPLHIGAVEYDLMIRFFNSDEREKEVGKKYTIKLSNHLLEGIKSIEISEQEKYKHKFLLFEFPFRQDGKDERKFYLILEIDDIQDEKPLLLIALRILFLRNRLWEAVKKYYSGVMNFRFYCDYIQPYVNNKENFQILHLTDLHLQDNERWAIGSTVLTEFTNKLKDLKSSNKIDLLVVTGDIINASNDAATAQRKYKRVANFLFKVAKILWGFKEDDSRIILPHDWKRRIIVTTGNHDYAAMNDVKVQTESRRIATGLPASQSGGTMAKYTYFIEFLSNFLDAPTQKLIKYDLNEIREYKNLGIIVGIFNSCSKANALQNNKVSFDIEKLNLVLEDSDWRRSQNLHLVFAHHSPKYCIDYFDDKYNSWEWKSFKDLYWEYFACLFKLLLKEKLVEEDTIKKFIEIKSKPSKKDLEFNNIFVENNFTDIDNNKFFKSFEDLRDSFKNDTKYIKLSNTELFKDMEMLYNILNRDIVLQDEYVIQYLTQARSLLVTTVDDYEKLNEAYDVVANHDNKCNNYMVVFAGHEHKAKRFLANNNYNIFVGHKFDDTEAQVGDEKKDGAIVFEIISFNKNSEINNAIYANFEPLKNEAKWYCDLDKDQENIIKTKLKLD